jgi:hypothetical protein
MRSRPGRRLITALCIAAALLLPLGAELHALAHVLTALQQANSAPDTRAPHTLPACDECLLFASVGAALPAHAAALQPVGDEPLVAPPGALPSRAEPFRAYASRAPPRGA